MLNWRDCFNVRLGAYISFASFVYDMFTDIEYITTVPYNSIELRRLAISFFIMPWLIVLSNLIWRLYHCYDDEINSAFFGSFHAAFSTGEIYYGFSAWWTGKNV